MPELDFWVQNLGLSISGAGVSDKILFTYSMLDENDWAKEAWFELNCERREYEVRKYWPKVETSRVDALVEALNERRDLGPMLRGMRDVFSEWFVENR